ncbi:MAG: DUF4349 domain-containing protein [Planctomycetaceae bacterium]
MFFRCTCFVGLLAAVGCGGASLDAPSTSFSAQETQPVSYLQQADSSAETQTAIDGAQPNSDIIAPVNRKIIYHAHLQIDVTNFGDAAAGVESIISQHGGFVASSRLGGQSGSTRSGQWTLRVPVQRYRSFVNELAHLGELRELNETSQEVSDEYFDLEARVRNKQQEEQRLLKHLDETTRQLPEILTIEREISRVRGEVEQMQGRLKLLADQTSLSTVELAIAEIETFVPAVSPTFAIRITRAWNGSTETLLNVLQGIAVGVTAVFPWITVLTIFGAVLLPIVVAVRRRSNIPAS